MEKFSLLSDNSQFASASAVYNVGGFCRTIVPVVGEQDAHLFLVATANVRSPNQVHLVEYNDTDNVIEKRQVISVPGEVWGISASPAVKNLFFVVCTNTTFERQCHLFSLELKNSAAEADNKGYKDGDTETGEDSSHEREPVLNVPEIEGYGSVVTVLWKPVIDDDGFGMEDLEGTAQAPDVDGEHTFITVHTNGFQIWTLLVTENGAQLQPREEARGVVWDPQVPVSETDMGIVTAAAWDPHHKNEIVLGVGRDLVTFNLAKLTEVRRRRGAHDSPITSIDFNSNKPWAALSAECNGRVRFWDLRQSSEIDVTADESADGGKESATAATASAKSLKVVNAHKHWVTAAQYNPAHDQLVLTSSTDQAVKLWRISSISSAPLMELDDAGLAISGHDSGDEAAYTSDSSTSAFRIPGDTPGATAADILVKTYEEHEDSVYSIAWSACESWIFASVSHAGRVCVSSVPSSEKYKILL